MENFAFLSELIRTYGYYIIGIGVFLESMGVPSPGETVLIMGGVAASLGQLNIVGVILVTVIAATLGDNMGYMVGKHYGMKLIKKLEHIHLFRVENQQKIEKFFHKHGNKTIFIGRFTLILRTYAALFAGIFKMPYQIFFFYNLTGAILWATTFGLLGYFLGYNLPLLEKIIVDFNSLVFVVVGIVIVFLIVRYFWKKNKNKKINEQKSN